LKDLVTHIWKLINYPEYDVDLMRHDAFVSDYEYYKSKNNNQTNQGFSRAPIYHFKFHEELKFGGALFIKFDAGAIIEPHIDDHVGRSTVIAIPLSPEFPHFAGIQYGDFEYGYTEQPLALNTQIEHSVHNNNYHRYSYQLCFENTIDEIKELDLENKIFLGV